MILPEGDVNHVLQTIEEMIWIRADEVGLSNTDGNDLADRVTDEVRSILTADLQ